VGEVSLLNEAIQALAIMTDPVRIGFLLLGVVIGLILGVIPGLGGLVGLSLLLPFTYDMNPYTALAFLLGLQSVTVTSDTIPAVLFGVPGTVGSAATILDGYPMARNGEAGRAFGAAFTASVIGGLAGALLLGVSIPILRPIMLSIGSPELLMICVFGLSLAAVLSGGSPLKGLAVACIGVLASTAGDEPQTGTLRWSESLYTWSGIPVVPVALGLFAVPEIADLVIQRKSIGGEAGKFMNMRMGQLQGVRDVFRSWFLVLRCSAIGAGLGAIPGIGASVVDWIAYGHAARSEKDAARTFGKGDVRGVIASESSNNAKEGGALVPTIAFGVPGSASMVLILGAFLVHGLIPGPDMLSKHLDITYAMVWSVAFANIFGAGICFAFATQLARVTLVPIGILAPVVLALVFIGAFQGSQHWGDIYVLLIFGFLGFIMKRLRWPRPPLILGFVLGGLVERYMFISFELYGAAWLWERPVVIIILLFTILGIVRLTISHLHERRKSVDAREKGAIGFQPRNVNVDLLFTLALLGFFITSLVISSRWEFGAKLVPQVVGWTAIFFLAIYGLISLFYRRGARKVTMRDGSGQTAEQGEGESDAHFDIVVDFGDLSPSVITRRAVSYLTWLVSVFGLAAVIGLLPAIFFFLAGYIRFSSKESWARTLSISIGLWVFCYVLFHRILVVPWPQAVIGDWFPVLRSIPAINLF
jgi:TctA family transporter